MKSSTIIKNENEPVYIFENLTNLINLCQNIKKPYIFLRIYVIIKIVKVG